MANIDWTGEVLDQIETHWQQRLRPRLEGLTDEEYFWQPVPGCWSVHPRGESTAPISWGSGEFTLDYGPDTEPTPVTTIAWRLGHLTECFASTNGVFFGGPLVDAQTFEYPGTAASALARLDEVYADFAAGVRSLGEAGLAEPQGRRSPPAFADAPVARVVRYMSVEAFHHGAEVCLLRDLYLKSADLILTPRRGT
ncbi:MAG: hypothetical protein JWM40_2365 [Frankiales bacterium]|nr:hypothetical protein [Frankiales bacterium]